MQHVRSYLPWLVGWIVIGLGQGIVTASITTLTIKVLLLGAARVLP